MLWFNKYASVLLWWLKKIKLSPFLKFWQVLIVEKAVQNFGFGVKCSFLRFLLFSQGGAFQILFSFSFLAHHARHTKALRQARKKSNTCLTGRQERQGPIPKGYRDIFPRNPQPPLCKNVQVHLKPALLLPSMDIFKGLPTPKALPIAIESRPHWPWTTLPPFYIHPPNKIR